MTTNREVHGVVARPHGIKMLWMVLAALAAVFCALVMIGMLTWASEDRNWFVFALAGFGAFGFAESVVNQWRERPRGYESAWSLWLTAAFWAAFGLYNASVAVWGLAIKDDSPDWGLVAFGSVLAALFLWFAFLHGRKALRG
jgi:hypothetical protein